MVKIGVKNQNKKYLGMEGVFHNATNELNSQSDEHIFWLVYSVRLMLLCNNQKYIVPLSILQGEEYVQCHKLLLHFFSILLVVPHGEGLCIRPCLNLCWRFRGAEKAQN
jgi:hypothetical protein